LIGGWESQRWGASIMKTAGRYSIFLAELVLVVFAVGYSQVQAAEVLENGGLELSTGPRGWTLTQSITGMPGAPINAVEHVDLAAFAPGGLGIYMRPFQGNLEPYEGQNKAINVSLQQTTASAIAGRTYTLTGHSYFQIAASNNVDTLFPDSPAGAVPSPTETYFQMEFLNASGAVIGAPARLDLPKNRTTDDPVADYLTHTLMATAPAGTARIRVTAAAEDMVASCTTACPAGQDVWFDDFTLRDNVVPGLERLQVIDGVNTGLLDLIGAPESWNVVKTPEDNIQFSSAPYAIHTGNAGMWLRSFSGGDAKIVQTVPGVAGEDYTFSGWSKWEVAYIGADPFSSTQTFMTMEFLDGSGTPIEITPGVDEVTLDLRTVQINDDTWRQFSLPTTEAPAGTVNVRVSAGATMMANSGIPSPQSAMFDDFSLITTALPPGVAGDFNNDGTVDAADYVVWRKHNGTNTPLPNDNGLGTPISSAHYDLWRASFGNMAGGGSGLAAVPEPGSIVLLAGIGLGMFACRPRGKR
jgi:hypothetical protein